MRTKLVKLGPLLALLLAGSVALAQSSGYELSRFTVDAGGGRSSGGGYTLAGTIGQPDAGSALSGGGFTLVGGYWPGEGGAPPPPPPPPGSGIVYLPVTRRFTFAAPCGPSNGYCEPNDAYEEAYGELEPGVEYSSYPGDNNDVYYFVVRNSDARVTIRVTNYVDGRLTLYDSGETEIDTTYEQAPGDLVMELRDVALSPDKYYIQIYTDERYWSSDRLYTLTVTID